VFLAISVIAAKLSTVKRKYLVLSGKGGVGKSTVSSLLSRAFAANQDTNVRYMDEAEIIRIIGF
jgi:Mrp family chromosome partitioning ATPase